MLLVCQPKNKLWEIYDLSGVVGTGEIGVDANRDVGPARVFPLTLRILVDELQQLCEEHWVSHRSLVARAGKHDHGHAPH